MDQDDGERRVARHERVVAIEPLRSADPATAAAAIIDFLDPAEAAVGVPLVDESERGRIDSVANGAAPPAGWLPLIARRDGQAVGYAALVPTADGGWRGDVALAPDHGVAATALTALLAALNRLVAASRTDPGSGTDPGAATVWLRHASADQVAQATADGGGVVLQRRLAVLGRGLEAVDGGDLDDEARRAGVRIRGFRPEQDEDAVVSVLAAAYAGSDDGGWDRARLLERTGYDWFRAEDLLIAEDAAPEAARGNAEEIKRRIAGIHWLKRRDERTGEVYNLAIAPHAQGRGIGTVLLAAGLEHLRASGLVEVLLWVDTANPRAVNLYTSRGFELRWEDVALGLGGYNHGAPA